MPPSSSSSSETRQELPGYVEFRWEQLQLSSGTPVGAGAISQVVSSTLASPLPPVPIVVKILSKVQLLQQKKVEAAMNEKRALLTLGPHPFVGRLYGTAQSDDELYFVMEALPHGDLLQHIRRAASRAVQAYSSNATTATTTCGGESKQSTAMGGVSVASTTIDMDGTGDASASSTANALVSIPPSARVQRCLCFHDIRLITAQLVLALARAYEVGIVLRDLKPENIVFDAKYRACLIDFDTVDLNGRGAAPQTNNGVAVKPREGEEGWEGGGGGSGDGYAGAGVRVPPTPPASAAAYAKRLSVSEIQGMRKKTASFCGTAQYVSPEMVGECRWSFSSDLWALGASVYEMVYGVHMFSGEGPFEVLRRVIRGVDGGAVPFPVIDLDDDNAAAAAGGEEEDEEDEGDVEDEEDGGSGSTASSTASGFQRVKDFILQLIRIDPAQRLGVDRATRGFDLAAFKRHALFAGFDWSIAESHLDTFRPRMFPTKGATTFTSTASTPTSDSDPDPSPSLASHYHQMPYNDPAYADYVYRATADANPFERFMQHILLDDESSHRKGASDISSLPALPADPKATTTAATAAATATSTTSRSGNEDGGGRDDMSDSDDVMDVIDDVGMNYTGMAADEDFQE